MAVLALLAWNGDQNFEPAYRLLGERADKPTSLLIHIPSFVQILDNFLWGET